jgi:two-component system NtrC family sensor kinase
MSRWFNDLPITAKSTLLLSLAAGIFLLLLASGSYYFAHRELQQTIATNQTAAVAGLASLLDHKLKAAKQYLAIQARHIQQSDHTGGLQALLDAHHEASLFFDAGMLVLSARGDILAETPFTGERIGQNHSQRDYFIQALAATTPLVSQPYRLSRPPHQPVVAISIPIRDQQGRLTLVLVGRLSLQGNGSLGNLVDEPIGKTGYFYMINRQRTLLLHPDRSRILETIAQGGNQTIDAALQGWKGTRENINSKGVAGLTTVYPLQEAPWFLAAHYPLSEAYAPLKRSKTWFFMLTLLILPSTVLAAWLSMRPVVRPLQRLTKHLQQLSDIQGEARFLPVTSKDEVGQLTTVFNELLQELDDDSAAQEESAEIYRVVTECTSEVAVWRLENGDIRYISPSCSDFFGYQEAEFYAEPSLLERLIDQEDREQWQLHQPGSCTTSGAGLLLRIRHKDGSVRHFRHHCQLVIDQQGQPNGVRSSWLDVTHQHQLETTMRRLTQAVEQSASMVLMTDTVGVIEYVNPVFYQITGYSPEEIIGSNIELLHSGEQTDADMQALWAVLESGQNWRGQFCNRRKDGSLFWVESSISPLYNRKNIITGYLAVQEDITGRKQAEEEMVTLLRQVTCAKREWEQTLDHLHDFIILTDQQHLIRRYNKILADVTGQEVSELVGHDWRDLLQQSGFRFVNFSGTTGELLHEHSQRSYDISVYPIMNEQEELQGYLVSLNDTTELRVTARDLEQTLSELGDAQSQIYQQEKMASIGQLAAGVAHEINNPMGFITSNLGSLDKYVNRLTEYIQVVDQAMQGCCEGEQSGMVQDARKRLKIDRILDDAHQLIAESLDGGARVRRIVQDLKSFSRVDQTEAALIDLNESLETTINIAWNEIKYVAELKREFGDIPKVKCFPQQLNQVFLNLLVNAAHALGETRGEITVHTEQQGDQVLVKIGDTGCGMPPEVQRRIFEPFFTTKEVGKGTGLGLSISYDIIKKHGGEITVESEVGRGTTFTVRLPAGGKA